MISVNTTELDIKTELTSVPIFYDHSLGNLLTIETYRVLIGFLYQTLL
jgi:hypothetical protein